MKGSFQPTRPGFSASNAGLRASSQAVRRSADRGSSTSRHLSQPVKVAVVQREDYGPIGLELSKDADLVQWLQQQLAAQQGPLRSAAAPAASHSQSKGWNVEPLAVSTPPQTVAAGTCAQQYSSKTQPLLKAKTLPMVQLAVGGWKRGSKFEGDLVLKCYFTKKKLCWEILDGNITFKCEMRWPEIQYLRSSEAEDVEVLELDLRQPPSFFEELDPQPKKRAVWKACQDFTGGQVSMGKRQTFVFLPGKLNLVLPDFFALNQHLKHDHSRVESPHPALPETEESNQQQPETKSVQPTYTELDFLGMISEGGYNYPSELPAELTTSIPSYSQSASSTSFTAPAVCSSEQEQTSSMETSILRVEEEPVDLGEPNPIRNSFDFDVPEFPSEISADTFLDLMRVDSRELGLPEEIAASLAAAAQAPAAPDDSTIVDEMMDWDALCS